MLIKAMLEQSFGLLSVESDLSIVDMIYVVVLLVAVVLVISSYAKIKKSVKKCKHFYAIF